MDIFTVHWIANLFKFHSKQKINPFANVDDVMTNGDETEFLTRAWIRPISY